MQGKLRDLVFAAVAVFVVLCGSKPATLWEFDEVLFAHSLQGYEPILHHPPPPGYPVFIFVARAVRVFTPSDFSALVALNIIASAAGFVLLALAFARLTDLATGITGALLFYLSPAMLVHSTLALSDPGALALLAATLFFLRSSPMLFATFAALTVGWRPQFCFFILPLLVVRLVEDRRSRLSILAIFTVVCLLWLIPLTMAVGGVDRLIQFESSQAKYVAEHDAEISRTSWQPARIAVHFLSHPWGPRVMAIPIFLAAAFGAWRMKRESIALPIAGAVYIAVALAIMDPADGVRYALPFQLVIAFLAGIGLLMFTRRFGFAVTQYETAILFAIGSIMYVSSLVSQRASTLSPPVAAAQAIPANAAVGYEMTLWPHSMYLLRGHPLYRIDAAVQKLFDTPKAPLYEFVNGTTDVRGARTFQWETSDAYWNLTRNLYRIVSIAPLGPQRRFKILRGVHLLEREDPAKSWRWIDADAAITAPHAAGVDLLLELPRSAPYAENRVTIEADGRVAGTAVLQRGKPLRLSVSFPSPASVVTFKAERSFTPSRDRRTLAFALLDLRYR